MVWRSIHVPVRLVERQFGRGNFDDAGDELVSALCYMSAWPDQFRYRFSFNTANPNPWYHAMVFEVEGLTDPEYAQLTQLVAERGLESE